MNSTPIPLESFISELYPTSLNQEEKALAATNLSEFVALLLDIQTESRKPNAW